MSEDDLWYYNEHLGEQASRFERRRNNDRFQRTWWVSPKRFTHQNDGLPAVLRRQRAVKIQPRLDAILCENEPRLGWSTVPQEPLFNDVQISLDYRAAPALASCSYFWAPDRMEEQEAELFYRKQSFLALLEAVPVEAACLLARHGLLQVKDSAASMPQRIAYLRRFHKNTDSWGPKKYKYMQGYFLSDRFGLSPDADEAIRSGQGVRINAQLSKKLYDLASIHPRLFDLLESYGLFFSSARSDSFA